MNSALRIPRSALKWRREIQFAADAAWPHTNKVNAGVRAEFKLPSDRPLA